MSAEDVKKWSGRAKPGMPLPRVPDTVRDAFILSKGIDWTASYIDPAGWLPQSRTIETATSIGYDTIKTQASGVCTKIAVNVCDGGPRGPRSMTSHGQHQDAAE